MGRAVPDRCDALVVGAGFAGMNQVVGQAPATFEKLRPRLAERAVAAGSRRA
ncbi:MAG: hypothetical protein QOH11_2310 [Solirubrobacteraceae bacterium]|jgi:succinate dehydrogenase/fumarate reductase flavoprotein subunit|nr:hypothetical protein [Solirubrobacteraceae bacterium]